MSSSISLLVTEQSVGRAATAVKDDVVAEQRGSLVLHTFTNAGLEVESGRCLRVG